MLRKEPTALLQQRPPTVPDSTRRKPEFQTVVVGVDFSPASLRAVRWVATRLSPDATLVLTHVVAQPALPVYIRTTPRPMSALPSRDIDGFTGGLLGLADTLGRERTLIIIRTGSPAERLAQVAEELGADMICIGRGPRPRDIARFGGSTPIRLLTWTRIPTLIVPMIDPGQTGPVVAGLDDRAGGHGVLDVARSMAGLVDGYVDAVHVIDSELRHLLASAPVASAPVASALVSSEPTQDRQSGARGDSWLDERALRWADRCIADTGSKASATAVVSDGDPGQELIRHARQRRATMIVVGQGGAADIPGVPVGALSPGSTTRVLVWASPCPVLVVPLAVAASTARADDAARARSLKNDESSDTHELVGVHAAYHPGVIS